MSVHPVCFGHLGFGQGTSHANPWNGPCTEPTPAGNGATWARTDAGTPSAAADSHARPQAGAGTRTGLSPRAACKVARDLAEYWRDVLAATTRGFVSSIRAEAEAKGEARGEAKSVLRVLERRGVDGWLDRALVVERIEDLFG